MNMGFDATAADEAFEEAMNEQLGKATIARKNTFNISGENVGQVFASNIESISNVVEGYKQLSEESFKNDAVFYYQSQKENFEKQINNIKSQVYQREQEVASLQENLKELQTEYD